MNETNDHPADTVAAADTAPDPVADRLGFDATTNFSILGWIWDRFRDKTGDRQEVDFDLK